MFLLCKGPEDVWALLDRGVPLTHVNVGNMAFVVGAKPVTRSVYVTPDHVRAFSAIAERGVQLTAQMMPTDRPVDLMALLREAGLAAG